MKVYYLIFILFIIVAAGCTQQNINEYVEEQKDDSSQTERINETEISEATSQFEWVPTSPVSMLTDEDIVLLGINCSGMPEDIAHCILDWQKEHFIYAGADADYSDAVDPLRWNYFLPGIYSSKEILFKKVDDEGKIYGVCFDYAVTYCSLAKYFGLNCTVFGTKTKPSESFSTYSLATTGLSREEYNRLEPLLEEHNLNFSYEVVRKVVSETPSHYWAEVLLDGKWVVMDATQDIRSLNFSTYDKFISKGDYVIVNWTALNRLREMEVYAEMERNGTLSLSTEESSQSEFEQGREMNSSVDYVGIIDDLGNEHRAKNISDFMQGYGLAPYFESCLKVCDFFEGTIPNCESECEYEIEFYNCYESCSKNNFYITCDFVCADEENFSSCYSSCSGEEYNEECDNNC